MDNLDDALATIAELGSGRELTRTISRIEARLGMLSREEATQSVARAGIDGTTLEAALAIKAVAGQINVIVHAVGILVSLPFVLEARETIESLSLGAGNTGRLHDLETDRQIAEFKFIGWRGGAESIRQNTLFVDFFNLATASTSKRRVLYVVGKTEPLRFLNNRRALSSVLSKNAGVAVRFKALYGDRFRTVREYYEYVGETIEIVDLRELVPALRLRRDP